MLRMQLLSSFNCTTIKNNVVYFNHLSIVLLSSRALRIPVIFQLYYYQAERFVFQSLFIAAQHCFAADAAGAASGLGAIFGGRRVPPAVPVYAPASSAAESWRWAASSTRRLVPYNRTFHAFGTFLCFVLQSAERILNVAN